MTDDHDPAEQYLAEVSHSLNALDALERDEIVAELRVHLMEAQAGGKDLADVLSALGDASSLAKAYELELALSKVPEGTPFGSVPRLVGVVIALGVPTFVIVFILSIFSTVATVMGVAAFVAAAVSPIVPHSWLPPEFKVKTALALGLPIALAGCIGGVILVVYVRALIRVIEQKSRGKPIRLDWSVLPRWMRPA